VIEDVFSGFETLARVDVPHFQTAVKPAIPVIHEGGVIRRLNDALDAFGSVACGGDWQGIAHGVSFTQSHGSDEERIILKTGLCLLLALSLHRFRKLI
jgi:hypothetical protein